MNKKELTPIEALRELRKITNSQHWIVQQFATSHLDIIETALKRIIELEEDRKVLETVRDNFNLWIEPEYKVTLQFLQCCSMSHGEYEKFIEYFGEPRDE